jgi:hypothetical protein
VAEELSLQVLEGIVSVPSEERLQELLRRPLNFGCRPTPIREPEGGFSVPVIGSEEDFEALRADGFELTIREPPERRAEVGKGDRFQGGRLTPRGFGRKVGGRGQPGASPS